MIIAIRNCHTVPLCAMSIKPNLVFQARPQSAKTWKTWTEQKFKWMLSREVESHLSAGFLFFISLILISSCLEKKKPLGVLSKLPTFFVPYLHVVNKQKAKSFSFFLHLHISKVRPSLKSEDVNAVLDPEQSTQPWHGGYWRDRLWPRL